MKTNTVIDNVFATISEKELIVILKEYKKFKTTGYLESESELRKLIDRVSELTGTPFNLEVIGVTHKILEMGALNWLNCIEGNC